MDILLREKIKELSDLLKNDARIIKLNELEKKMESSEEVMALSYKKDIAAMNYSDSIKYFGEEHKNTKEKLKALHQAKILLDSHPIVKDYLHAYSSVKILLKSINDILFKDFKVECGK